MNWFRPSIEKEIRRRRIRLLLHSTHLYKNLPLILADGRIHTARELILKHGREGAARFLHDPKRYEKFAVGLEYINCALTVPNVELLYHRSTTEWQAEWVHLALDLNLLMSADTRFCPVSAASAKGQFIKSGLDGFRSLFASDVESHNRQDLAPDLPTHPQAEVLLKGPLDLSLVRSILVPSHSAQQEVSRLCDHSGSRLNVRIAPHLFVWPAHLSKSPL